MRQALEQMRAQFGWQGVAGLILLALAGAFNFLALQPLEQQTMFVHSSIEQARTKATSRARPNGLAGRQYELERFFDSLPAEQDVTDILAKIYLVAEASGVAIKQEDYHLEAKDSPRVEYVMIFPVKGEYVNIRAFLARVLADHPALALDGISFHRDKIDDSTLNADIRLTLFLKPME